MRHREIGLGPLVGLGLLLGLVPAGCGGGGAKADGGGAGGAGGIGVGASGGNATGGNAAGGNATGGNATGGNATGGSASGRGGARAPIGSWPPAMTTSNAATLTGAMLGKCDGSAPRRKKIPLVINGGSADFGYGDMYLVEYSSNTTYALLFGIVTNLGSTMHCNVAAPPNGYDWYDGQGKSMNVTGSPAIIGSEGDVGTPIYVNSCLAPGETGMILGSRGSDGPGSLFDVVGSVSLALTYSGDGAVPAASLVPERYTVDSGSFTAIFKNVGTATAFLPTWGADGYLPGLWVAFDQSGLPFTSGRFGETGPHVPGDYTVGPAEEGYGLALTDNFVGCATQLRVYIDFHRGDAVQ